MEVPDSRVHFSGATKETQGPIVTVTTVVMVITVVTLITDKQLEQVTYFKILMQPVMPYRATPQPWPRGGVHNSK